MIKLFTGNINEALQTIKPAVILNISDVRGAGIHPMSNVLFRDYPEYNEMLNQLKYNQVDRRGIAGKFMYRKRHNVVHALGFIDITKISTTNGMYHNTPLISILTDLNRSMMAGSERSVAIPYYGLKSSGYHFLDFLTAIESIFDESITVYISVSGQYTDRTELETLYFNSPIIENGKRTIYSAKGIQSNEFNLDNAISRKRTNQPYKSNSAILDKFYGNLKPSLH